MLQSKSLLAAILYLPLSLHAEDFTAADALSYIDAKLYELEATSIPEDPLNTAWVTEKLAGMKACDQFIRTQIDPIAQKFNLIGEERSKYDRGIHLRWTTVDARNTLYLKQILDHHEWIDISAFGAAAEINAWLIAQHADLDWEFQQRVLSILKIKVAAGEARKSHYPYLYDRVAQAHNRPTKRKPQKFGTQGFCNNSGEWEPFELEEPTKVDELRAQYGLVSMEEYKTWFNCPQTQSERP